MSTPTPHGETTYLVRLSGDLSIKAGGTRRRFIGRLVENLADALTRAGIEHRIERRRFRLFVTASRPDTPDVVARVFGVQSCSRCERVPAPDADTLVDAAVARFGEAVRGRTFAVRARRSGNTHAIPFVSAEVERALGARLVECGGTVDLSAPEVTAGIEIHPGHAYLFTDTVPGPGGLPVGAQGRALSLLSGGFDSAVSSWLMLKRGVTLDYLFCNLGGEPHRRGVLRVAKVLTDAWSAGAAPRVFELDFSPVVAAIQEHITHRYWQIVLKRMMFAAADRVAAELRTPALVTGDAVGQVSSQTLAAMAAIGRDTGAAVLRPLLGFNKDEIVELARRIGTYAISADVEEYCAMTPRKPATHASVAALSDEEARLPAGLLEGVLEARVLHDLRAIDAATLSPGAPAAQEPPEDAVWIDLRPAPAYRRWHVPEALHLEYYEALRAYRSFASDRTYVLYCEVGLKSGHLAELMRAHGLSALHVTGGTGALSADPFAADLLRS